MSAQHTLIAAPFASDVTLDSEHARRVMSFPRSEVRVESMAQRDAGNRDTRLGALLNDLDFEGFGVGTALWLHELPA